MEKLTLQEALELCMEHWNYMGEYGDILSDDNGFLPCNIKHEIGDLIGVGGCAACAYAYDHNTECWECIIPWSGTGGCLDNTYSEYTAWLINPTKQNALKIAYLAESELDRLGL